ncbi:uncharacterized protein [Mytilus edulis]|uniref:uncharacterized protein isoform X2 n=1 Tax=Mytilus edulis TaxID=6550 RepID=UPI0039F13E06
MGNKESSDYNMNRDDEEIEGGKYYAKSTNGIDNPGLNVSLSSLQKDPEQKHSNDTLTLEKNVGLQNFHPSVKWRDSEKLETRSYPEINRQLVNKKLTMMKKNSTAMEAEDVQQNEKIPLKRRLSLGDIPMTETNGKHLLSPDECFYIGRADSTARMSNSEANSVCRHRIRITEVVPSHSSIIDGRETDWRLSLHQFSSKKQNKEERSKFSKRIRSYYKAQDELIGAFEDIQLGVDEDMDDSEEARQLMKTAGLYAKITFFANLVLLAAKAVAAFLSGSISIISSLVDSVVDLSSGIIIWVTGRAIRQRLPYVYPQGRTKLEPIAIVILSVVMSLASVQLIRESIEKIINLTTGDSKPPTVDIATIVITASAIVIKFVLWLVCRRIKTPTVQALALDHRNDVLSNAVALVCGYVGSQELLDKTGEKGLIYVDPIGAIVISIYIIINWWITGYGQIKMLTGHTAKPDFLKKLTWICVNHHPKVQYVDTVRAFHFGNNFLVEVDIVLPEDMTLKEAHDIGEPLQQKLERLKEVERAFVHLDYEFEHNPLTEHKMA